jgi:hypothetical protein
MAERSSTAAYKYCALEHAGDLEGLIQHIYCRWVKTVVIAAYILRAQPVNVRSETRRKPRPSHIPKRE